MPARGALTRPIRVFTTHLKGFLIARAVLPCAREELTSADEELICDSEELMCADEDLVIANEELMSASEDLVCADEELVIANEELVIANEELVIANEELICASEELISADEELICANEDLICAHELLPSHDQTHDRDRSASFCAQSPHVHQKPMLTPIHPPTHTHHPPPPTPIRIFAKPQIRRPESGFSTSLPLPPSLPSSPLPFSRIPVPLFPPLSVFSPLPPSTLPLFPSPSSSRHRAFVPISSPSSLRVSVSPW